MYSHRDVGDMPLYVHVALLVFIYIYKGASPTVHSLSSSGSSVFKLALMCNKFVTKCTCIIHIERAHCMCLQGI